MSRAKTEPKKVVTHVHRTLVSERDEKGKSTQKEYLWYTAYYEEKNHRGVPYNANPEVVMVYDYCLAHTNEILAGGNPVQDLVNAHMIPESNPSGEENETDIDFAGKTLRSVDSTKI